MPPGSSLLSSPEVQGMIRQKAEAEYRRNRGALSDSISALSPDIARFSNLRNRHIADVNDTRSERERLASSASSAMAQRLGAPATSYAGSLSQALAGAKARTGVMNRGEEAIKNQQLKDRLQIVRAAIQKRGRGIASLGRVANIREGVDVSSQAAGDFSSASNANLFGGLAGIGVGLAQSYFQNRPPSIADQYDSGTLFNVNTPPPASLPGIGVNPVMDA